MSTDSEWKVYVDKFGNTLVREGPRVVCSGVRRETDANLIAAVPELLKLVEEMVRLGSGVHWDDWFELAEAAISKATGEAS